MFDCSNPQKRFYAVLVYIQNHLDQYLTLEKISKVANLSPYHFHRQFKSFSGENLHDYVKRLRLEKAAFMMKHSEHSITDISYNCGYETSSSFSKAFKYQFGETPRAFRNTGFAIDEELPNHHALPTIETLEDQQVLFHRGTGPYVLAAKSAWQGLMQQAYQLGLFTESTIVIGITYDSPDITNQDNIRYDACIVIDNDTAGPKSVATQRIHGGRYAVFQHIGPYHLISALYDHIYGQWLPDSGERLRDQPVFCRYLNQQSDNVSEDELITDVCLPLV